MRTLILKSVLPVALLFTQAVHAQVASAAAAGTVAVAPHLVGAAPAVFTSAVTSGSAHIGQAIVAKLASSATLSDGTRLPAGTQLLGHITEVTPFSKNGGQSSLGMIFDRFKGAGGQEHQLGSSMLKSIRGAMTQTDDASADAGFSANAPRAGSARGNASTSASGGGLLGGVTSGVGSAVNSAGNTVGNTVNGLGSTVNETSQGLARTAGSLTGALSSATGTLSARGQNVNVPAGTQVTVASSVQASAK